MDIAFNIFRYDIRKLESAPEIFSQDGETNPYQTPEELLASFFRAPNQALSKRKKNGYETFDLGIVGMHEGVALAIVENNKKVKRIIKHKEEKMDHHPFTHIIFDTRKGKPYVCAACKGGFGSDGQELKELLTQGLNNFLGHYGLEIALTRLKKKREEFWNSVDDIVRLFEDRPVYIKIDFSQPLYDKCPPAECDDAIVAAIMQIASMKGGGNRVLNIRNHLKNEIHLNEMQETLVHVARHCLRYPQHTLQIRFRNYGLYRVGNDVEARFTVDKKLVEQFASGQQKMVFGPNECSLSLLDWLEGIYQLLTEYHDETALEAPAAAMYC